MTPSCDFWCQATYVLTPDTAMTALVAGFLVGLVYLSQVAYLRSLLIVLLFVGEAFLISAVFARWVDGAPEWPRTITWAFLWVAYLATAWFGSWARRWLHRARA